MCVRTHSFQLPSRLPSTYLLLFRGERRPKWAVAAPCEQGDSLRQASRRDATLLLTPVESVSH